MNFKAGNYV
jgi:hypothetical protein